MSSFKRFRSPVWLAAGFLGTPGIAAATNYGLNLPVGVTEISARVYGLHMLILWICVAIAVVVFSAMFYSIWKHRKSQGAKAAHFHENVGVEVVWTLIPFLILIGMAIPATRVLIAMEDTSNTDLTIKVTGYQWKWHYDYVGEEVGFFSNMSTARAEILGLVDKGEHYLRDVDNPLVLPVGKRVRLLLTADDVIHAWWVPELALKKDAIPGFINELWTRIDEPGVYRGQCAELCGRDHAYMPIVVVALEEAAWETWMNEQRGQRAGTQALVDTLDAEGGDVLALRMEDGKRVHDAHCAACHQVSGEGIPGVFPAIRGSSIALGSLDAHLDIVLRGKPGTSMPAFGTQLNDDDLASVLTYQRNAWGNASGEVVLTEQVSAAR